METEHLRRPRSKRRVLLITFTSIVALIALGWLLGIPADLGFSTWRRPTGKWQPPNSKEHKHEALDPVRVHHGPITPLPDIDVDIYTSDMNKPKFSNLPNNEVSNDNPPPSASGLPRLALDKILKDARPIFGTYENVQSNTSTWMSRYADETKIVHMNIPGTHDSATWNYTYDTQQALKHVTDLVNDNIQPASFFQCQDRSLVQMLNAGIRAFDLRYAQDITKSTLVFWHGSALQSQIATVEDVLFGFYQWLDDHPSEALFLSFQYEASASMGNANSADVQMQLYNILTSCAAQKYVLQTRDRFGTLGEARGRITLLRRFDFDLVPRYCEQTIPGIHLSPQAWTVNGAEIELVFNTDAGIAGIAYIEDYYRPLTNRNSTSEENIKAKMNATEAHLRKAASMHPNSLFWTFASSTNTGNDPPNTPRTQALGSGYDAGVNQQLVPVLKEMKGKRLGLVMFDFFEEPDELLPLFLSLLEP